MAILNSFRALVLLSVAVVLVWYNGIDPMSFIERRTPANSFNNTLAITVSPSADISLGTIVQLSWPAQSGSGQFVLELWQKQSNSESFVYTVGSYGLTTGNLKWHVPNSLTGYEHTLYMYVVDTRGKRTPYAKSLVRVLSAPQNSKLIQVTSPTQRSLWFLGAKNTISFNYQTGTDFNSWGADVYSLVSGSPVYFGKTVCDGQASNSRSCTFEVEDAWGTGRFYFRFFVYDTNNQIEYTNSDYFTVSRSNDDVGEQDLIEVLAPEYEDEAVKGQTFTIKWKPESKFVGFNIELYNANTKKYSDAFVDAIVANLPANATSYAWKVPTELKTSRRFFLKIYGFLFKSDGSIDTENTGVGYSQFFVISTTRGKTDEDLEPPCVGSNCALSPTEGDDPLVTINGRRTTVRRNDSNDNGPNAFVFVLCLLGLYIFTI